jgi:hypothetical protein
MSYLRDTDLNGRVEVEGEVESRAGAGRPGEAKPTGERLK